MALDLVLTMTATYDAYPQSGEDAESTADPGERSDDSSAGHLSPWSDESSEHDIFVETGAMESDTTFHTEKAPASDLSESMKGVESTLSQLIRLGFKIRQSADTERLRMAHATLATEEQKALRQELTIKLSVSRSNPKPSDGLSKVQTRLVNSVLSRRNLVTYVCPVGDCESPDICYASIKDWESHLYQDHTQNTYWRCPACRERTDTSNDFVYHVQQNHEKILDPDLLDDFAESCKHSELVPLICPVCGDRNNCTLDDIGQHIHTFSLPPLSWPVTDPSPDEVQPSQRIEPPVSHNDYLADEDEPADSNNGKGHEAAHSNRFVVSESRRLVNDYHVDTEQSNEPLILKDKDWDIYSVSGVAAVQMLAQALQSLSNITGDVVCISPVYQADYSPELDTAEAHALQLAAVTRRFFLKAAPPFSITDYLLRIHKFSPHSPGVYLAAAAYIHRLCVVETMVPITPRTVHRLVLATIRIASKSLEDNRWTQERIARLGGVSTNELRKLEISFCYLLNFDLFLRHEDLQRSMWLLQSTARHRISLDEGSNRDKSSLHAGDTTRNIVTAF
ncbi:unnamed protein product [Aureobasidium vineae]|uniref:C2H2-type domain-containing protein n=1 Tax=Aureobasidium vineae TaxID=2773715 RepID=A0A9N8JAQ0_9PEZI|nr:unnamed protein product [Aureobasidium vineae]